jgi:hypothetical protein
MRGARYACAVLATVLLVAGCGSSGREISNRFGDCTFRPKTVCRDQDLSSIAASNSDLNGADLSGSNLTGADLRNVSLRGAKLVKTRFNGADLTAADLRNADLSGAFMVGTTLDHADMSNTNQSGVTFCNTVMPDGTVTDCKFLESTTPGKPAKPPRILQARAHRPVHCIVDGIGDGIEVDYRVKNAQSVVFSVDDVRVSDSRFVEGIQRIPFTCDGHVHTVNLQAFGKAPPPASRSFRVSVEEGTPEPMPR